ncbi:MAG: tetratricopeptide repeat protein, partial [Planctomycetota bacterium]
WIHNYMFAVLCACGATTSVRSTRAGLTVECSACGDRIRVPALRTLREYADRGEPAPSSSPVSGTVQSNSIPESFATHYWGEVGTTGRVSASAMNNFLGEVQAKVAEFVRRIGDSSRFELLVSCALIPDRKPVVILESSPQAVETDSISQLRSEIAALPIPPVIDGPVAFVVYQRVRLSAPDQIPIQPFGPYQSQIQTDGVDAAMMDVALRASGERRDWFGERWMNVLRRVFSQPAGAGSKKKKDVPARLETDHERSKRWVDYVESNAEGAPEPFLLTGAETKPSVHVARAWASSKFSFLGRQNQLIPEPLELSCRIALAARAQAAEDWKKAIEWYSAAIELEPCCGLLYGRRATMHQVMGNRQPALSDWNRSIELAPEESWFFVHRAEIFADLDAWPQAQADLDVACRLAPREPEFLLRRAIAKSTQEQPLAAIDDLDAVLVLDPNSGHAHGQLGLMYQNDEAVDASLAEQHLSRAVELMPDSIDPLIHRSLFFASINKLELAMEDCDQILRMQPESEVGHGLRGRVQQLMGDYDEAIKTCSHAIELGCRLPLVYLARAAAYASTEQLGLARLDCDEALELDPENPAACHLRGMLSVQEGELETAMEAFEKAREYAPDWADPRAHLALVHRLNEDPESAVAEQSDLIEKQPDTGGHYLNRAFAYAQLGEFENARRDHDRACELEPENEHFYYFRGCYLVDRQQPENALEDFDRVLELAGDYDNARLRRASLLLQLKRQQEALADYEHLIAKHPDDPQAYSGRAYAHQMFGNESAADRDLEQVKEIAPEHSEAMDLQAVHAKVSWLETQERYDDAIDVANDVIESSPDAPEGYRLRAYMYWYSEQFVEAFDDYSRLLEMTPDDPDLLNCRGQVQAEMGEHRDALDDLDRAIDKSRELGQSQVLAFALNGRALALAGIDRMDESRQDYEESVRLCPNNAWAYYNRGLVLFQSGELELAQKAIRRSLECDQPQLTKRKRERATAILSKT